MLTKSEDLKYQLESLASYEPSDIDNPEFEVGYEDNKGNNGFATVCCVDVAKRALERIKALEGRNDNELRGLPKDIDLLITAATSLIAKVKSGGLISDRVVHLEKITTKVNEQYQALFK